MWRDAPRLSALCLLALALACESGPTTSPADGGACTAGLLGCRCADDGSCRAGTCCAGTCRRLSDDPKNCGACGEVCAGEPGTVPICMDASCLRGPCAPGQLDCDGDARSGCEVDSTTDVDNCGGCRVKCTAGPHKVPRCDNAICGDACAAGYSDCNGAAMDGCETFTREDPQNCGGCGSRCPAELPYCVGGRCAATGCLDGGRAPPPPCTAGKDVARLEPWVVCTADCASAWLSQNDYRGGSFHAQSICRSLGYRGWSGWGATRSSICGTGQKNTSCASPGTSSFEFTPEEYNLGKDAEGPIIGTQVQWKCSN